MGFFDFLFGKGNAELIEVLANPVVVVDVRTASEFRQGHVKGSVNIPLDSLQHKVNALKKYKKPLVLCCASGVRSASGVSILRQAGFTEVYNGRTWRKVDGLMNN